MVHDGAHVADARHREALDALCNAQPRFLHLAPEGSKGRRGRRAAGVAGDRGAQFSVVAAAHLLGEEAAARAQHAGDLRGPSPGVAIDDEAEGAVREGQLLVGRGRDDPHSEGVEPRPSHRHVGGIALRRRGVRRQGGQRSEPLAPTGADVQEAADAGERRTDQGGGHLGAGVGWTGAVVVAPPERMPPHQVLDRDFRQDWVVDTTRIREELGFAEPPSPHNALRTAAAWELAHPPAGWEAAAFDDPAEDRALQTLTTSPG